MGEGFEAETEAIVARVENRKAETLYETDYLLGVYDENRMGALGFGIYKPAIGK